LLTHTFIAEADKLIANLSYKQHLALYIFKKRLLRVLLSKVINHPEYALFCVRIVVEMHLHMFLAKDYIGVARLLPSAVVYLKSCSVTLVHKRENEQLIDYAEGLFDKAFSFADKQ
jgi:hypothetical protein